MVPDQYPDTVLAQYTRGPLAIASWAHIVNAHVFPGPAIITSLKAGAVIAIQNLKKCVSTEIFVGTPQLSENEEDDSDDVDEDSELDDHRTIGGKTRAQSDAERKGVKATTTIYQTFEKPSDRSSLASSGSEPDLLDREALLEKIGDPPLGRALLLFAQMSSEDNLMDEKYARECVKLAHAHKDFVMGFIAQEDLNERDVDNFLSFTPGVKLPPADAAEKNGVHLIKGDGMGQRYNTPAEVVGRRGCDVVIVGRGIVGAKDRRREAERYRREAWKAYEARLE
jgi:uridine monophosphate synthetase